MALLRAGIRAFRMHSGSRVGMSGAIGSCRVSGEVAPLMGLRLTTMAGGDEGLTTRSFAKYSGKGGQVPKGYVVSPAMIATGQAPQGKAFMRSPNKLAEPYRLLKPIPWSSYLTTDGWRERWKRIMGSFKSMYTLSRCRKDIPGWKLAPFKEEAAALYKEVSSFLADGNQKSLEKLTTGAIYSDMKRELRLRGEGGWSHISWDLLGMDAVELVHARMFVLDPKDVSNHFAQLTLRFKSRQSFAAFDKAGQLVAGEEGREVHVEDFWVLERASKQPDARWRVAARLSPV